MCSRNLLSNFLFSFSISFSYSAEFSLNFYIASYSCRKMCWVESTSTPIASIIIFLTFSIIKNSLSLSDLNYFFLAFFSKSRLASLISSIVAVLKSNFGISISLSKSISSSISFPIIRSFKRFLCRTSKIIDSNLGTETMVEIVGLAVKIGIGLIEGMLTGVLTSSKI